MNSFQFQTVPNIISGLGSIQQLRELLTTRPYQHLLLVTDADMLQHQLHLPILEILEDLSLTYSIYSEVEADPGEQKLYGCCKNYCHTQPSCTAATVS